MAQLRLQPPEPFDFRHPDDWTRWHRRFEQFRTASGLADEGDARQVSMLLYCMGQEADDVLMTTGITTEDRKKYDRVLEKLNGFFKVRRNLVFERAHFNQRSQGENESVEKYITELYHLAEICEYGDLKEQLLRDRIVVGIRDTVVRPACVAIIDSRTKQFAEHSTRANDDFDLSP